MSALTPAREKIEKLKVNRAPRTARDSEQLPAFPQAILSRAKCTAYVAISAPKTLPAMTSLTK